MNRADRSNWFEGREGWAKAGLVIVYVSVWVVTSLVITVIVGRFLGYLAIALLLTSPLSGLYQGILKVSTRRKSVWKRYLWLPAGLYAVLVVSGAFMEPDFISWILPATGYLAVLFGIMAAQAALAECAINACLEHAPARS
jgi:hypothetical protein